MVFDSDKCFKKDGTPLKAYDSKLSAEEGASYVKLKYGNEQVPYQCDKCNFLLYIMIIFGTISSVSAKGFFQTTTK